MQRRHAYVAALVAVLVGLLAATQDSAIALAARAVPEGATVLHGHNEHMTVSNPGQVHSYVWRTPTVHPSAGAFRAFNVGGRTNFTVIRTAVPTPAGPTAYPAIMRGCYWNVCSPDMKLPKRISSIHHLASTWHTTGRFSPGSHNTAYDIWIGKHRQTKGHADGAELMIWLNWRCCGEISSPRFRLGGHDYRFQWWVAKDRSTGKAYSGMTWNYLQFRFAQQRSRVTGLNLMPFIHYAERRGLIKPSWWIENVQGGNEIWSGSHGLGTRYFRVSVW